MAISTGMMEMSRDRQRYEEEMIYRKRQYEMEMMRQQMMGAGQLGYYQPQELQKPQPQEAPKQIPLLLLL